MSHVRFVQHRAVHFVALLLWFVPGCRSATLKSDQVDLREAVINLYREQLFDNIVRFKRMEPMLLVTYSQLQGQVTTKVSGSGTATKAELDNTFGAPPGVGNVTDVDTLTHSLSVTIGQDIALTLRGDPVTLADTYNAIIKFAQTAGYLERGKEPPGDANSYVAMKRFGDEYYWVPESARPAFIDLYNQTVLKFNPGKLFSTLQELMDFNSAPMIQSVQ